MHLCGTGNELSYIHMCKLSLSGKSASRFSLLFVQIAILAAVG